MILNRYKAVICWKHKPEVAGEIRQDAVIVIFAVVFVVVVVVVVFVYVIVVVKPPWCICCSVSFRKKSPCLAFILPPQPS